MLFSLNLGKKMKLGELEKLVLNYFWHNQDADVKTVFKFFARSRGGSLNTIQSTLDRLFKKGLLVRTKQSHAFVYNAAMDQQQFIGQLITQVTQDFTNDHQDSLATAFVSLSTQFDDQQLDKLEQQIRAHRIHNLQGQDDNG